MPDNAKELALIVDDPDAPGGTWVHWVLYGIPAGVQALPEGVRKADRPDNLPGAAQGGNSWGKVGYGGPMPPAGRPHRYEFKLYALDTALNLRPGATKADLLEAMRGHVVAQGHLMGTYQRK